jgi:hypothetical protein
VPPLDQLRPPARRPTRRSAATHSPSRRPPSESGRGQGHGRQRPGTRSVPSPQPAPIEGRGRPLQDRGIGLLIIFTAGVLVMVALITLTAIIGAWWILAPVMVVDFAVTASMLAVIARLLES